jgi:alpha-tubulin suppressor-like RCC1 family protein
MMGAAGAGGAVPAPDPGPMYAWGDNQTSGTVGDNTEINRSSPVQIGDLETWTVVAGYQTRFAVKEDGTLWAWGSNRVGEQGHGDVVERSSPVQVGSLTDWGQGYHQIDGDYYHFMFVKSDGTLWGTGSNGAGQLGQNNVISRSSPVQVGSLTTWSKVCAHGTMTHAIKTDGTLWAIGSGYRGAGGNGDVLSYSSPIQIGSATTWTDISGGTQFTIGISDGKLFAWGRNKRGKMGFDGSTAGISAIATEGEMSSPVQVGTLTDWSKIQCTSDSALGVTDSGKLFSWGESFMGRLGLNDATNHSSPTQVGSLTDWVDISSGAGLAGSVKANGTLWMWGGGAGGSGGGVGDGNAIHRSSPVQIGSLTDWSDVHAEWYVGSGIRGG